MPVFLACLSGSLAMAAEKSLVEKGAYLTTAADCYVCHTDTKNGGKPFAGGLALKTPFGTFYTPNITPDKKTGIGAWSDAEFLRALKEGIGPGGHPLYPAFPYTSFTKIKEVDALAIHAYLKSLPAVDHPNKPQELKAPFSWRWLLWGWRLMFFKEGPYVPPEGATEKIARGGYLVEALGHCGECHTPRNVLGGSEQSLYLAGTASGPDGEIVPNITPDPETGIGNWSEADLVSFMKDGMTPDYDNVQGSMAEVITNSLSKLTEEDRAAIAAYLKSVKPIKHRVERAG